MKFFKIYSLVTLFLSKKYAHFAIFIQQYINSLEK